ncbi:collagen-binding domain-containing protein, partial [Vagococcus fessus]
MLNINKNSITKVLIATVLLGTGSTGIAQRSYSETKHTIADESKISSNLFDYNVFLSGYHSADSADIEGPLAVVKDSSFGKELETYSYAAMFSENANTVGTPLDFDIQKTAILIGGNINNYSDTIQPVVESRNYKSEKIGWLDSDHANDKGYFKKVSINEVQKKLLTEEFESSTLTKMTAEMKSLTSDLDSKSVMGKKSGKTLGEWSDGKLLEYDYYQSASDSDILVLNIPPKEIDGELVAVVQSFGFDYESVIDNESIKNIIVTSQDEAGNKADKVIFKGNYLANHSGTNAVLELTDVKASENAKKVIYNFSKANQVSNFFDRSSQNAEIKPPKDIIQMDKGVLDSGDERYGKSYLKQYATASGTNGSAEYGGGTAVIGSIVAPLATVVFSSGNINGYLFATDLHQRNHMEVHNFWNQWPKEPTEPKFGTIEVIKHDSGDKEKLLSGAEFDVINEAGETVDHIVIGKD